VSAKRAKARRGGGRLAPASRGAGRRKVVRAQYVRARSTPTLI